MSREELRFEILKWAFGVNPTEKSALALAETAFAFAMENPTPDTPTDGDFRAIAPRPDQFPVGAFVKRGEAL